MVDGYIKLLYPDGSFAKEDIEECLKMALEMRRRVKEQLKKLGGMEFYDVNFSYIDQETFEEKFVSVPVLESGNKGHSQVGKKGPFPVNLKGPIGYK